MWKCGVWKRTFFPSTLYISTFLHFHTSSLSHPQPHLLRKRPDVGRVHGIAVGGEDMELSGDLGAKAVVEGAGSLRHPVDKEGHLLIPQFHVGVDALPCSGTTAQFYRFTA